MSSLQSVTHRSVSYRKEVTTGEVVTPDKQQAIPRNVLGLLVAYRILNALVLRTYFQPDEYFQALEPAWRIAFGPQSRAWLTWEWKYNLRSALHPSIFAVAYRLADAASDLAGFSPPVRAEILVVAPKVVQAFIAAWGDYYTWNLARVVFPDDFLISNTALFLTVASPWQWFCSTRMFSNCLETTLTVTALCYWPWHWQEDPSQRDGTTDKSIKADHMKQKSVKPPGRSGDETSRLRLALLFAAIATILRPTNILVWLILTTHMFWPVRTSTQTFKTPNKTLERQTSTGVLGYTIGPTQSQCILLLRESILCGGLVVAVSGVVDRMFYHEWTLPTLNFLYFNVIQSLAVFYGNNNWHYYLSQGYPLLLTTALPFTVMGFYQIFTASQSSTIPKSTRSHGILRSLALICLIVPGILSIISHKEVRFIYPLLPALHIITAPPLTQFLKQTSIFKPAFSSSPSQTKKFLLIFLLTITMSISVFTTALLYPGQVTIQTHLRQQFEQHYLPRPAFESPFPPSNKNMTIGYLMPCHSTPWRSHLQYPASESHPGIKAWALTCEPPVNLTPDEKAAYLDEADQFYADPYKWVRRYMSRHPPAGRNVIDDKTTPDPRSRGQRVWKLPLDTADDRFDPAQEKGEGDYWNTTTFESSVREWPDYLVFFAGLESVLSTVLRGSGYGECERVWNGWFHEDWRRRGDIVVWCVNHDRTRMRK